jgi:hypothetical protein
MHVNAFFGFSFPLPGDTAYRIARASSNKRSEHNLFGLVQEKGDALLSVSAQQMDSKLSEQLMSVAPRISINGQGFSKAASKQKKDGGTVWKIMYLTAIDGYLLQFDIQSPDQNIAEDLQHCVEGTRFFDPNRAKTIAGANSKAYNPALIK